MAISDLNPGERVKNVGFTEDAVQVDLMDGRTILVPLACIQGCFTLRRNSGNIGKFVAAVTAFIGRRLTKT